MSAGAHRRRTSTLLALVALSAAACSGEGALLGASAEGVGGNSADAGLGDLPPPPPRSGTGCPGLDVFGACRGSVAVWCEDGRERSLDCAPLGRACEWLDDTTGYYCGNTPADGVPAEPEGGGGEAPPAEPDKPPPSPDDVPPRDPDEPLIPPGPEPEPGPEPAPPDEEKPPPAPPPAPGPGPDGDDEPAPAPPPDGDDEPAPAPPPDGDDEPAPAPEPPAPDDPPPGPPSPDDPPAPGDECGGVTYLGECDGTVALWCAEGQLARRDCANFEQTCGFVNDQYGFYCLEGEAAPPVPPDDGSHEPAPPVPEDDAPPSAPAPPPEDDADDPPEPSPPESECGDIDYFGVCEGAVVVFCQDDVLVRHDCLPGGLTCGWASDADGNWCVDG